ncbi:PBP1A family penicillin-binding protein [Alkalihalophilus lindianensis]|uniref:PBP1A family penicillin-binding protein n=1 Tax=Alkalihalophilus lindianensis TaxID=1630542 RepID=A0ABU3XCE1_9BACI|nr:PBP1A family penicillin-binding protein [Alkalihalophilus lindianensis]MDV2685545.1 PBP1A family penicillin-binding protein [Alkalihalophilus lindianensis]
MANQPQTRQEKNKGKKKSSLFIKVMTVFTILIVVAGAIGSVQIYGLVQSAPSIDDDTFAFANSSTLYDQSDEEIISLSNGENRQSTSIEDIPDHVKDAFIAIEDVRFHEHSGLDIKRIGGAVVSNITNGFGAEGGSTITQQVVKNSLLTSEKSVTRKVQEAYLALELEKHYTKDEILELYLNKIYFGNGAYGIVTAADTYFGKDVQDLTVNEAALLAGLPQRPSGYDPYQNPELAKERRDTVLYVMREHQFITADEYNEELSVSIEEMLNEKSEEESISDAFMDQVYKELEQIEGMTSSMIYNGGLKIYTTYDPDAQAHVEQVLNSDEFVSYPDDRFQAGVTVIDNQTGEIKAIGGGRNQESGKDRSNYATKIQRSPGSTIKPILSYGPAIEHLKWSTYQQIEDEEMTYTGSDQVIRNYNGQYHGVMSIREALTQSWNIPAVKTFQEVGEADAKQFAENVGISIEGSAYESYALGSFEKGISPLELGGAYATFGNGGTYNEPHAVRKVVFPDGKEINMQPEGVEAMNDYTAYMVTDMLKSVVEDGTGRHASIDGVPVAGKTGTTNFNEETKQKYNIDEGVPDVWFAGYTSNYTAAVWTGYPRISEDTYIQTREDRQIAQHIFREVMTGMVNEETSDFTKPDSVQEIKVDTKTGERATSSSSQSDIVTELFVTGTDVKDAYSLVEDELEKKQEAVKEEEEKEKEKEELEPEPEKEDNNDEGEESSTSSSEENESDIKEDEAEEEEEDNEDE